MAQLESFPGAAHFKFRTPDAISLCQVTRAEVRNSRTQHNSRALRAQATSIFRILPFKHLREVPPARSPARLVSGFGI
eukprot:7943403-Alexandrium_andersonii.AAC.1